MEIIAVPRGKQARARQSVNPGELKRRADFLAIASLYMQLRRSSTQYLGLCPFHRERHASFYLDPKRKLFHCFGCLRGGDIFDFVMTAEGCDFRSAMRIVSDFVSGVARESS
ncbi:MAG: CHC2 zinc finger domain-containing protein, partial [Candidatus Acidiferrales bacterium]